MQKNKLTPFLIYILLTFFPFQGIGELPPVDQADLVSRTYKTWEGIFRFSSRSIVRIEGGQSLHVLSYRCEKNDGVLINFAEAKTDGTFKLLREANPNIKGVTPCFDGIDVFPNTSGAEIIVRWRHSGQGGSRTVEKFIYTETGLSLVTRSHFMYRKNGASWTSAETLASEEANATNSSPRHVQDIAMEDSTPRAINKIKQHRETAPFKTSTTNNESTINHKNIEYFSEQDADASIPFPYSRLILFALVIGILLSIAILKFKQK